MSIIGRLFGNRRKLTNFFKTRRRQLPTGIAVDAGRIDKKVSCDIGVESFFFIGHGETPIL
jgi:hypothetical protein